MEKIVVSIVLVLLAIAYLRRLTKNKRSTRRARMLDEIPGIQDEVIEAARALTFESATEPAAELHFKLLELVDRVQKCLGMVYSGVLTTKISTMNAYSIRWYCPDTQMLLLEFNASRSYHQGSIVPWQWSRNFTFYEGPNHFSLERYAFARSFVSLEEYPELQELRKVFWAQSMAMIAAYSEDHQEL